MRDREKEKDKHRDATTAALVPLPLYHQVENSKLSIDYKEKLTVLQHSIESYRQHMQPDDDDGEMFENKNLSKKFLFLLLL
jgi:hypothetical protein